MLEKIQNLLRITKDDSPEFIRIVRTILIISLVATIALIVLLGGFQGNRINPVTITVLGVLFLFMAAALFFVIRGNTLLAQLSIPLALIVSITVIAFGADSIHDQSVIAYALTIIIGGFLQGERGVFLTAGMASIGVVFLGYADIAGITTNNMASNTRPEDGFIISIILFVIAGVLNLVMNRLNDSLKRAKNNEQAQLQANRELKDLQVSLEERVASRTKELQETSSQLERRAKDFEAISDISRSMASIREVEKLLPTVAHLISERFGFYHIGIFTLDENNEYAVLSAANSEGGARMMQRGHKLKVEPGSLVGYAASRTLPKIALDVGAEAVFFNNPDLPDTKSEIALPLLVGTQTIGVLDVQSTESGAFTDQAVNILSTLANQVAISIQNARSFSETRRALSESEKIYRQYVQQGWKRVTSETPNLGYVYSTKGVNQLNTPINTPEIRTATASGDRVITPQQKGEATSIAVPVKLRGQVIGVLNIHSTDGSHKWDDDELALIQAAADRAALALENARLLEDSQRRASKERAIGELSARISAATNIDSILQTAVTEIGRTIGNSEVSIQFRKPQGN
jgi:GAF domain-containing protein